MDIDINAAMLKIIRGQKRWSQQTLADKAGVSLSTIKRIEGSKINKKCHATQANRLAAALGVDLEDITENNFPMLFDLGGDVELCLDKYVDAEDFRKSYEDILKMALRRQDVMWKIGKKLKGDPRPDRTDFASR